MKKLLPVVCALGLFLNSFTSQTWAKEIQEPENVNITKSKIISQKEKVKSVKKTSKHHKKSNKNTEEVEIEQVKKPEEVLQYVVLPPKEEVNIQLTARRAILVDGKTGQVLYEKDAELPWHPASTTKVMSALLILENGKLEDITTVSSSATALYGGYYSNWLSPGMKFTIDQLLHILLIESDNASCNTLAEYLDGTQEKFVERMNRRAQELGLKSHFMTPYGMTHDLHYVSAKDLYLITKEAMKYPAFREIVRTPVYHISTPYMEHSFRNRNQFIGVDPRVLGVKTGYTSAAQCNLVCYAEDGEHSLYTVVMGSPRRDGDYSYPDSKKLLDYGFKILKEAPRIPVTIDQQAKL